MPVFVGTAGTAGRAGNRVDSGLPSWEARDKMALVIGIAVFPRLAFPTPGRNSDAQAMIDSGVLAIRGLARVADKTVHAMDIAALPTLESDTRKARLPIDSIGSYAVLALAVLKNPGKIGFVAFAVLALYMPQKAQACDDTVPVVDLVVFAFFFDSVELAVPLLLPGLRPYRDEGLPPSQSQLARLYKAPLCCTVFHLH